MAARTARALVIATVAACGTRAPTPAAAAAADPLADRFPLARLDERALCDRLLARDAAAYRVSVDPTPGRRRKVIVSDLHLGPGTRDPRFSGIEDFYSDSTWTELVAREAAAGPTDLIIAGDFIEFWQIAAALHVLPARDARVQPAAGPVLAEDQAFGVEAVEIVIAAHPTVFRDLGRWIASGDHRVILLAGNHDADLLWPKVQLAIAHAIAPVDPARLVFVDAAAYEQGGVHVEHGHAYDAANRFTTGHAPFGRDADGRCRLQASWGEIFVDRFYTETERQIPFIDNLYPESAAVLWALQASPDPQRDLGAALRFVELIRVAETGELNRDAVGAALQGVFGTPGAHDRGPESAREVVEHLTERLGAGDATAEAVVGAVSRLARDPELATLWTGIARAATSLPDVGAALAALRAIDPDALTHLRELAFGDSMLAAAQRIVAARSGISIVVLGHTHHPGGEVQRFAARGGDAYYVNTGSWISVASVEQLRARGVTWDRLSLADRSMFPSRATTVTIEYEGDTPHPVVRNALH
jgi:UDP-2,3-diacylglucosamine pyrophosphatase LpxH